MGKNGKTIGKMVAECGGWADSEGLNLVYMRLFSAGDGRCLTMGEAFQGPGSTSGLGSTDFGLERFRN